MEERVGARLRAHPFFCRPPRYVPNRTRWPDPDLNPPMLQFRNTPIRMPQFANG